MNARSGTSVCPVDGATDLPAGGRRCDHRVASHEGGDPVPIGNRVAELRGVIELEWKQFGMHWGSYRYNVIVRGDRSGEIRRG